MGPSFPSSSGLLQLSGCGFENRRRFTRGFLSSGGDRSSIGEAFPVAILYATKFWISNQNIKERPNRPKYSHKGAIGFTTSQVLENRREAYVLFVSGGRILVEISPRRHFFQSLSVWLYLRRDELNSATADGEAKTVRFEVRRERHERRGGKQDALPKALMKKVRSGSFFFCFTRLVGLKANIWIWRIKCLSKQKLNDQSY